MNYTISQLLTFIDKGIQNIFWGVKSDQVSTPSSKF